MRKELAKAQGGGPSMHSKDLGSILSLFEE